MALHRPEPDYFTLRRGAPNTRTIQDQLSSAADELSDEEMVDVDEPPDAIALDATPKPSAAKIMSSQTTAEFAKKACALERKQSLLTQMIHTSDSDSNHEDESLFSDARRAHSSASTWSRCSAASTADLTSDDHTSPARSASPSPPMPPSQVQHLPPIFNTKPFNGPPTIRFARTEAIDPLQKPAISANEQTVEAGLGRKRCIAFACGARKEEVKKAEPPKEENVKPAEPAKRPSALKFICPTRPGADPATPLSRPARLRSPPPPAQRLPSSPKAADRPHRGSDSTVRNDSPKSARKSPLATFKPRRPSHDRSPTRPGALRIQEFSGQEEDIDDWVQEATCNRSRLTVSDTLNLENRLRKIGAEAEEEAMEEEEEEEQDNDDDVDEDELDEDEDEEMEDVADDYSTDEGFQTDDEEGFANSDDDSDAGSDYAWWAPGRGTSAEPVEHIRPSSRKSNSDSSIGSFSSAHGFPAINIQNRRRKLSPRMPRPRSPELPDSTDFVCGTLDEDRPLEVAYLTQLEQRRAAKHKAVPQDIDPTFPTSDPEMEEEDEDSEHDFDESDHPFMHGNMDMHEDVEMDERQPRGLVPRKRSPPHSPRRLQSPPPAKRKIHLSPPPPVKRNVHRSPPPRKLFGQSPKRAWSPPPHGRPLRSPPPTRRTSFTKAGNKQQQQQQQPIGLASRPPLGLASSVPRRCSEFLRMQPPSDDEDDSPQTAGEALPTRGAIDIVKGLEKKRQFRREKMYEKHCRNKNKKPEKVLQPGKGFQKMREMGMELAAYRGKRPPPIWPGGQLPMGGGEDAQHILSY